MGSAIASLEAVIKGTCFEAEEFVYEDPNKYTKIINPSQITGLELYEPESYEIPIERIERDRFVCTNLYQTIQTVSGF
jgi:hypothetical protein